MLVAEDPVRKQLNLELKQYYEIYSLWTSSNHRLGSAFDVRRVFVFGKLVRNCCYKNVWGASVLYCALINIVS